MDTDGDIGWGPTGRKNRVHIRMKNDRERVLEKQLGSRGSNPSQEGTARWLTKAGTAWSGSRATANDQSGQLPSRKSPFRDVLWDAEATQGFFPGDPWENDTTAIFLLVHPHKPLGGRKSVGNTGQ